MILLGLFWESITFLWVSVLKRSVAAYWDTPDDTMDGWTDG
jgi:hypothetical protein